MDAVEGQDFNPWPVVRSLLYERFGSDDLMQIIDSTGLDVDWSLTDAQAYSHTTRIRAFRPRVDETVRRLPAARQLAVASAIAVDMIRRHPELAPDLATRLEQIGWTLGGSGLTSGDLDLREKFFPSGSDHDAYVAIREILHRAKARITIIDPYAGSEIFALLTQPPPIKLEVRILTSNVSADFRVELAKFRKQHLSYEVGVRTTRDFHDRFILIDDSEAYHVGASLKDAGSRSFMISRLEDTANRDALFAAHEAAWAKAATLV